MDTRPAVLMPGSRRFPQPWHVDEATESFCIRDANGQALAYVYLRMRPDGGWRRIG